MNIRSICLLMVIFGCFASYGATITVNPGQTIQSGINAAVAGDTVMVNSGTYNSGINLNKSVMVQANGVVTVAPTTPGTGVGLDIECSNCGVVGIRFVDWGDLDWDYGRNHSNVTLKNCLFRRSGFWGIDGANWLIEGNEFDRPMRGADNTISLFGSGHVFRRNYFHGWVIPEDVMDGQHMDHIQFWNNNGEILRDILIEENIFTDYVQAIFIANERTITGPDQPRNITVRNNVFWGTDLTPGPDNLNRPSHTVFMGKGWGTTIGGVANAVITNNIMRYGANQISMYGMPATTIVQGNIISEGGADYTLSEGTTDLSRGTIGNISWQSSWHPLGQGPDKFIDPQYQNRNAVGAAVLGPDGIPFTTDDAWRPMAAAAAGYGPQLGVVTPPPNQAPSANAGPDRAVTLAAGQTTVTVDLLGSGTDPDGTIAAYRWTGTPDPADVAQPTVILAAGMYTFALNVTDNLGLASTVDTMLVTVNSAPLNITPQANAGPDRVITLAAGQTTATVQLLGSGIDSDGSIVAYRWIGTPDPADVAQPTVTVAAGASYTFGLFVTDDDGAESIVDTMLLTVNSAPPPAETWEPIQVRSRAGSWIWVWATKQTAKPVTKP